MGWVNLDYQYLLPMGWVNWHHYYWWLSPMGWVNLEPVFLPGNSEVHRDLKHLQHSIGNILAASGEQTKPAQKLGYLEVTCSESFTSEISLMEKVKCVASADIEHQIINIIVTYLEITCSESFTSEISLMEKVKASIIFWSPAGLSGGWLIDWLIDWLI